MSASRLYPKVYKGKEESGGYLATNETRKSDSSPHYRGRIYIEGIGWYWLSGWVRERRSGEMISISVKEMTDTDAKQYCSEKTAKKTTSPNADSRTSSEPEQAQEQEDDIPF